MLDSVDEACGIGQDKQELAHDVQQDRLYQQGGKLKVEMDWLKITVNQDVMKCRNMCSSNRNSRS